MRCRIDVLYAGLQLVDPAKGRSMQRRPMKCPQDDVLGEQLEGPDIALYGVDNGTYATDNICNHGPMCQAGSTINHRRP